MGNRFDSKISGELANTANSILEEMCLAEPRAEFSELALARVLAHRHEFNRSCAIKIALTRPLEEQKILLKDPTSYIETFGITEQNAEFFGFLSYIAAENKLLEDLTLVLSDQNTEYVSFYEHQLPRYIGIYLKLKFLNEQQNIDLQYALYKFIRHKLDGESVSAQERRQFNEITRDFTNVLKRSAKALAEYAIKHSDQYENFEDWSDELEFWSSATKKQSAVGRLKKSVS